MYLLANFFDFTPWVLFALRLVLGAIFIAHGKGKLFGGVSGFAGMLKGQGFPLPTVFAWIAACTEFFGGVLLVLGFLLNPASALLIVFMLVATYLKVFKWKKGLVDGYELDILLIGGLLILLAQGGGAFAL